MVKPRTLRLVAICAIIAGSPVAAEPAGPAPLARVVLIGAHWCAPCRAELPEIGALAAAARPVRIALGWTDRRPILPANAAAAVDVLPVSTAQDLTARHGMAARGLPFAVAYRADGKACTVWRGPLTPADWPKLVQACSLPTPPQAAQ